MVSGLIDVLSQKAAGSRGYCKKARNLKDLAEDRKFISKIDHTSGTNVIVCDRVEALYDE